MDEAIFKMKFTYTELERIRWLVESQLKFLLKGRDITDFQKETEGKILDKLHKKIVTTLKNKLEEINLKEKNNVQEKQNSSIT